MQLSIVGQVATSQRLAQTGLTARVVDFTFFPFGPLFSRNKPQIERVEQISDAYHLKLGGEDVMVAYLIEVTRAGARPAAPGLTAGDPRAGGGRHEREREHRAEGRRPGSCGERARVPRARRP